MNTLLIVFVAVAALAIVMQALVLFALYKTGKQTAERVETLAKRFEDEALPTIEITRQMLVENGPKVKDIINDLSETASILRAKTQAASATADVAIDRARLQIVRADELATRTLDRVEETTNSLHYIINTPIRQVTAVISGVLAGLSQFTGNRKVRRAMKATPNEEMFI
jgi:hypothetical protein